MYVVCLLLLSIKFDESQDLLPFILEISQEKEPIPETLADLHLLMGLWDREDLKPYSGCLWVSGRREEEGILGKCHILHH